MPLETDAYGVERFVDPRSGEDVAISRLFMVAEEGVEATEGRAVVADDGVPWNITSSNLSLVPPAELLRGMGAGTGGKTGPEGLPRGTGWSERRKLAAIRAFEAESGREIDDMAAVMAGAGVNQ